VATPKYLTFYKICSKRTNKLQVIQVRLALLRIYWSLRFDWLKATVSHMSFDAIFGPHDAITSLILYDANLGARFYSAARGTSLLWSIQVIWCVGCGDMGHFIPTKTSILGLRTGGRIENDNKYNKE
jgi:hypothetical protein